MDLFQVCIQFRIFRASWFPLTGYVLHLVCHERDDHLFICGCKKTGWIDSGSACSGRAPHRTGTDRGLREIIILPQPVGLRREVTVENIAFVVLETPWHNNQDVAFADPCPLLDLAFYPAHALDTIHAADADMVGTHHQFCAGKLFV